MKKRFIPLLLTLLLITAMGCKKAEGTTGNTLAENSAAKKSGAGSSDDTLDADSSYAFGMFIASEFSLPGVVYDYTAFVDGYKDFLDDNTRFGMDEAIEIVQAVYIEAMGKQAQESQETEEQFLSENRLKPGVITTPSGLQYEIISQGNGKKPRPEDTIRVHYRGTLINGTVFDSSYDRGEPAEFRLGEVIPGWVEGLQLMSEGGIFRFYIPSALAYGEQNLPNIPSFSTLIFDVELLSIVAK